MNLFEFEGQTALPRRRYPGAAELSGTLVRGAAGPALSLCPEGTDDDRRTRQSRRYQGLPKRGGFPPIRSGHPRNDHQGAPGSRAACRGNGLPERELYLSITLQGVKAPTLIASAMGGMEIERVAAEHPQELLRIELDPFLGLKAYQRRALARKLKVADDAKFAAFLERLQKIFFEKDALLVEINPLGVIGGELVAMDAKVVLDDHARFRHEPLFSALEETRASLGYHTPQGDGTTITYVPLDGEIGLISDGARYRNARPRPRHPGGRQGCELLRAGRHHARPR